MKAVQYLILGAGPTGLGACWRLDAAGHNDWLMVEASATAGGLAGSCVDEHGFTWDFGGHVQFSHYDYFDDVMDLVLGPQGWLHHDREAWVWMLNRFIPYPLQHNLHRLPAELGAACVDEILNLAADKSTRPAHFEQWLERQFGPSLTDAFMRPYNHKVWAWPLHDMNTTWVGERVATLDRQRVAANFVAQRDDVGWGPNNQFRFPASGGTGAIWKALARHLQANNNDRLCFDTAVTHIDTRRRVATLSSGEQVHYESLLSTQALDSLVALLDPAPAHAEHASALGYSTTEVIGVALNGQPTAGLEHKCWMYFPEPEVPFYRVTVFSNYSPANVPNPGSQWSLMAEVAHSAHRPPPETDIKHAVTKGMVHAQLIPDTRAIHHIWHRQLDHGYPVPTLQRDVILSAVIPALEEHGIYSRGRFGGWKYEVSNQDHCFAQGVELVERWLYGTTEATFTLA